MNLLCLLIGASSLTLFGIGLSLVHAIQNLHTAMVACATALAKALERQAKAQEAVGRQIGLHVDLSVLPENERLNEHQFRRTLKG